MLLNTWLSAAKRHIFNVSEAGSCARRRPGAAQPRQLQTEQLESRTLLTALVINDDNVDNFVDATGNLSVTNLELGTNDTLVIERLTLDSTAEGISIDLSNIELERLAIETVTINSFTGAAIDVNLVNVTGNRTIAIEDVIANSTASNDVGVRVNLDNTDVYALTVEDSSLAGVDITLINGANVSHGIITENQISAPAGHRGIELDVNASSADNFRIVDNFDVTAADQDAIRVNLMDSPVDGLVIDNNVVGNEPGANVTFRAEGDTFVQPFELTNNASDGELLQEFVLDLRDLGLVFDIDPVLGKPFSAQTNAAGIDTGTLTGIGTPILSSNNQVLALPFTDFAPGETLLFVIDVDVAPLVPGGTPQDFSTFGRDLIGADVSFQFGPGNNSGPKSVMGTMVGDPDVFNASEFVRGGDGSTAQDLQGINLVLQNSPLTNASVSENTVTGVFGNGIQFDTAQQSDVSAIISGNTVLSSGQDGLHFDLEDGNFTGAIIDNSIGGNFGHGVAFAPTVSRTGLVEGLVDGAPVIVTSTNHQLQTGDQIVLQGIVNDDPTVSHPANGLQTVTRIDNNRFSLDGVSGLPANVVYAGGGAWYIPDIQPDGSARGLVEIDLQSTEPQGRIQEFQNVVASDVQVTSVDHGLTTGDRIRIDGAAGTGISGVQSFKITVIDGNTFSLDGLAAVGTYDKSGGLATWTTNIVESATSMDEIVITSTSHGLVTGDEVRVLGMTITEGGETRPSSGNGRFTVTKLTDDTFLLQNSQANGVHTPGSGYWVPFEEVTFSGDRLPQIVSGNSIDGNGRAGFFVDLSTGTRFDGDIVNNTVNGNGAKGVHILSRSFGLGTNLPLDPNDPNALPTIRDVSFNVNIGTSTTDGNDISSNDQAGVVIEALDFATGSFEINGNRINANQTDDNSNDPFDHYMGDGIVVRLDSDRLTSESEAFLSESIIENNQIGVDSRGNEGNGLSFSQTDRTKIQDLEVNNNFFLNSGLDGFHFVRTEDGDLNSVIFEGNDATNNAGDGFDIFAQNTVSDELDFRIRNSNIDNNSEYGIRIDVQADARVAFDVSGTRIRENGSTMTGGFNPDDDPSPAGTGVMGQSGGIGIHGFQQVDIDFIAEDVQILDNIGDGFSVDAETFFDTVEVNASFTDSSLNGNTLTGFRSVGAAFASYEWIRSDFLGNGSDGARIISNVDTNDFFNRRVGGQDIDVFGLGNNFQLNGESGVVLGMGVSAVFGNGDPTDNFANEFGGTLDEDYRGFSAGSIGGNAGDGLKVVQEAGPYLRNEGRRRVIETDGNFFTFNGGDGVDIGHFAATEGGNVLHGDEVISDVDVILNRADLSDNQGDGVEYLADSVFRVGPVTGGGQDGIANLNVSSLSISKSFVKDNVGRGVDILNRRNEDSRITLFDNEIIGNGLVGIYVVNTSTHDQLQSGPDDPLEADFGDVFTFFDPNIELRVQDNLIESNGTASQETRVPINDDQNQGDNSLLANPNYIPETNLIQGTIGGLVIRVGTSDSPGFLIAANPDRELGLAGIDAEVWKNSFDGNFGADVYFDNFVSAVPDQAQSHFDTRTNPNFRWVDGPRDPLARLDLVFRENTGNSLDVINGFAFIDNEDSLFKNRTGSPTRVDPGPFGSQTDRKRNGTRTIGYLNNIGDDPGDVNLWGGSGAQAVDPAPGGFWSYDGWGTTTWRVESDFVGQNSFTDTSPIFGLSDFFQEVNLGGALAEEHYQWDTGVNVPGFTGATPYSLDRGDIFNVQQNEAPIAPDALEENDSFLGATQLVTDPITGEPAPLSGTFMVNNLAPTGNLNIEKKGDRDYYSLVAAGTGTLTLDVAHNDALGDFLSFLIYEVDPEQNSSEVAMVTAANGVPIRSQVAAGGVGFLAVEVVAGRTYIVEMLSNEDSNYGQAAFGKNFEYGTLRSYSLTINAPVGPAPVFAAPSVEIPEVVFTTNPGALAAASIENANPVLVDISDVSPDPISTALNTLTVTFTEDVTGVDRTDFQLTRNSQVLDTSGILVTQIDPMTYEISNLAELTNEVGNYQFRLVVANSGIVDTDLDPLVVGGNEIEAWVLDNSVDFTGDSEDNIPGDQAIADVNGNRSLRAAINEANANFGPDIIELAAGTYILSLAERFEDQGFSGDLDIRESLTIRGNGATASDTVIDAAQVDRVFHVFPGVELTLENLTIQGGEAYDGAGLFIEGLSTVAGDAAASPGIVRMTDVNVIDNEAYNQGGGIYNLGIVDAERASISRNTAGSRGGGIFNHGQVDLLNATVSSNFAVSRGGGVYNEVRASAVNLAIDPVVTVSQLNAVNVTIAFNHAESAGGGIFQEAPSRAQIGNTIIDQNTAKALPNIAGQVNSQGTNFVGDLGTDIAKADVALLASDIVADPAMGINSAGLNPLSSGTGNGTWVHTLVAGAEAIDAGNNAVYATAANVPNVLATLIAQQDQTGSTRLVEGDDDGTFTIDIGASEFFLSQPIAIITATPNPAGVGEVVNFSAQNSTHSLVPGTSKIELYEWDFNYDGTTFVPSISSPTADTATHVYNSEGSFQAALRVTDDTGAIDIAIITIVVSAPNAPVIVTPFAGGTSDSTPFISWTGGDGRFDLLVTNVGTNEVVIDQTGLTVKSFTPTTPLAPGTYRAIVTAINLSGETESAPYIFEVIRIAVIDPGQLDLEFDTTPEITFTAIPDAERYQVWVTQLDPVTRQGIGIPINESNINAATALIPGTNTAIYEPTTVLTEGLYRVWVRAFDANGNAGDWSIGNTFTITKPIVTGPAFQTGSTIDSTPTITWTDIDANQYQVWLTQLNGRDVNGVLLPSAQLVLNTVVTGTSLTPPPIGNGNFRVWVRAIGDDGEAGLWSDPYDFTRNLNVGPLLLSPIDGVNQTDRTPVFVWEAQEGATHYEIWVNSSTGIRQIIHETNVPHVQGAETITYTDTSTVLFNATYRWWVRAFNQDGAMTGWSVSETFFVPVPVITGPMGTVNGTNLPTFTWTGVPEYETYELWVNNVDTQQSRVIYEQGITGTSFTPELPLENGTFRFWVRGIDSVGNASQWSNPVTFTLDATIGNSPVLIDPADSAAVFDNTPQFQFSGVPNVSSYEILVKNMLATSQPTVLRETFVPTQDITTGDLSHSSTTSLVSGTYRWWVRGLNADGTPGPWSQPLDFRVVSNDEQQQRDSDFAEQPAMLASLNADNAWHDDLHSITVHPAAVVVATMTTEAEVVIDDQVTEADTIAAEETSIGVDSVMEELATADWWRLEDESPVSEQTASPVTAGVEIDPNSTSSDQQAAASVMGLALAATTTRRRRPKNRDQE